MGMVGSLVVGAWPMGSCGTRAGFCWTARPNRRTCRRRLDERWNRMGTPDLRISTCGRWGREVRGGGVHRGARTEAGGGLPDLFREHDELVHVTVEVRQCQGMRAQVPRRRRRLRRDMDEMTPLAH